MRILQLCSARTLGGGERHVADLSNSLARRGHEVYTALASASPLADLLADVPPSNIKRFRLRNALDVMSARALARFIREQRIEIVHAHLARDYPLAALAVRSNPMAQLIITRHVLFPLGKLHRLTFKRAACVIAVSGAVARKLLAQALVDKQKIRVVLNGIALNRFERSAEATALREAMRLRLNAGGQLLVGIVGNILPVKGQEDFVRAAALIAGRKADVRFCIIGDDETPRREHRARLERLIDELELRARVQLLSWPEDLAPLYAALDVLVSASRSEAFGLAMAEAMASGTAVVATATEGAQEIIEDGATGVLVPIGDAQELAQAVTALLEDRDERQRMAGRASAAARERFGLTRMIEATERIYQEVVR